MAREGLGRRGFLLSLGAAGAPDFESGRVEAGGGVLDVQFRPADFKLPREALLDWVLGSARAVSAYYGRFPVPQAELRIHSAAGAGVSNGHTFGYGGARSEISVGRETSRRDLREDWMLTHEMVHLAFPDVAERHHWIEEGTATYVEPIARAQAGDLDPERLWGEVARDLPQGLPGPGDQGLDRTHTWGRTYWGGALFCLLADVGIRRQTANVKGLQDALRAILQEGGDIRVHWPLEKALEIGDRATGGRVLASLYGKLAFEPVNVDLPALWRELGVRREGSRARFDETAPLAAARRAIVRPETQH